MRYLARLLALLLSLLCVLATGCLRPAQSRAERDEEVGRASTTDLSLVVEDGLAAVRHISPERIELWASAPEIVLVLTRPNADERSIVLEVHNVMPGTVVVPVTGSARVSDVEVLHPTRLRCHATLETAEVVLRVAAPATTTQDSFRIALLSDIQSGIDRLSDIHALINDDPSVVFLLGAGDLTQQGGQSELERYQRELLSLNVPYYTTLGNHELGTDPPPWHDYFGRANLHFVFRGVSFTLLDSGNATIDPLVYGWLEGWLEQARLRPHVVATHYPIIDPIGVRNGSFASRAEAGKLITMLGRGGVDLLVHGHIHSHYRYETGGIETYISGGGGAIPERFDGIGRHFMVFDLHPERGLLHARVVRVD
jgi:predicted phosphodiesterase